MPSGAYPGSTLVLALAVAAAMTSAVPVVASSFPAAPAASAPDLVPTEMTVSPETVHDTDVVQLHVRIENQGELAAWAATVTFVDVRPNGDVAWIGEDSLSGPLNPGATVVLTATFVAVGVGDHTLTARVVEVIPAESNATNDFVSIRLTVRSAGGNPGPPPPPDSVRIQALEGLGLGGLLVIVLIAIAGFAISIAGRGRSDDSLVPPPPEPPDRRPPPIWPP